MGFFRGNLKRILIVFNPRSSKRDLIQAEVFAQARELKGWLVGKFEVSRENVDENAVRLAEMIKDGDLVVVAGGDGTAAVGVNAVTIAQKKAVLGVLGYGNFNDTAEMFLGGDLKEIVEKFEAGQMEDFYPLRVEVDGRFWRYAAGYVTIGMFAESTEVFNSEKVRKKLQIRGGRANFSYWSLAKWYFLNRKRKFLGEFKLNGEDVVKNTTDYVAVNGLRVAKVMKGGKWFLMKERFLSGSFALGGVFSLGKFMFRSIFFGISGKESRGDVIEFLEPSEVEIHAEGEYMRLKDVRKIEVGKGNAIKIIA